MTAEAPVANGSSPVIKMLDRSAILAQPDIQTEVVDVPEWGGAVLVRGMTGQERDSWDRSMVRDKDDGKIEMDWKNMRAKLLVRTVVDSEGNRLFQDSDADLLGEKSAAAIARVFPVAQRLSGLRDEDVEEKANDLGNARSGSSGSDSP